MMRYDFDKAVDRRGTDSIKWEVGEQELPMWIADMDFATAPEIVEAMQERVSHGVFGYTGIPDEWRTAISDWWAKRYGVSYEKEWLIFGTSVIGIILSAIRRMTGEGDGVVLLTPVYNSFFNSVENNGRKCAECPLLYENGQYRIDWEALEKALSDERTKLMILCNPHNPTGQIWDRESLLRIAELCEKYNVYVISDEIHCDLTEPGEQYVPFLSVNEWAREHGIACISPTKTFNLAGLHTAAAVIPDDALREKIAYALRIDGIAEANVFAMTTAIAGYLKGEEWLEQLRVYLSENMRTAKQYIEKEISILKPVERKATYLLWVDCGKLPGVKENGVGGFVRVLRETTGLIVTAGTQYRGNGKSFIRINLAAPRKIVEDGLHRLADGVRRYLEHGQEDRG